jgi:hypothetical protein
MRTTIAVAAKRRYFVLFICPLCSSGRLKELEFGGHSLGERAAAFGYGRR